MGVEVSMRRYRRMLVWDVLLALGLLMPAGAVLSADGFRQLGQGVLTIVPPDESVNDVAQVFSLHELAQGRGETWDPAHAPSHQTLIGMARDRQFLRDTWCLEFAYKPPRTIEVDMPEEGYKLRPKKVWYLVYRVKNIGGRRVVFDKDKDSPDKEDRTKPRLEKINNLSIRFEPQFIFETHEALSRDEGLLEHRDFLDRLTPTAMEPISRREKIPLETLNDSISIAEKPLEPNEERWGVAIWQEVDPRIDFFTIFAYGLTNAMTWRHEADLEADLDHAPEYERREMECLRLDFYHPGDETHGEFEEVQVVHAGMFEQLALGSRLLEAASRAKLTKAEYLAGVRQLGVQWRDFLEPTKAQWTGGAGLRPVEKFAETLARVDDPAEREILVRAFLGDQAIGWMEDLLRAVAGPASPQWDAKRREALQTVGLKPEQVAVEPLRSFAAIVRKLELAPDLETRREQSAMFFDQAADRVDQIAHEVAIARAAALLKILQVDERALLQVGSRRALGFITPHIVTQAAPAEDDPSRVVDRDELEQEELLQGLFGHEGPELFKRAQGAQEGQDYRWLFREARQEDIL